MTLPEVYLTTRGSVGMQMYKQTNAAPGDADFRYEPTFGEATSTCRAIAYSPDGRFVAWGATDSVKVTTVSTLDNVNTLPHPRTSHIRFSPQGNYVTLWETFVTNKDNPEGSPNLHIYATSNWELLYSAKQRKVIEWEPHWSYDESVTAIMLGGEALFFEPKTDKGFTKCAHKLGGGRNGAISLSPGQRATHLAYYVAGANSMPSMCKIFKYPNLQGLPITSKSMFQVDNVEMKWNVMGTGLLLLTSVEVDATNASYYGRSALHYLTTKGDSFGVTLGKDGPIHDFAWSPKSNEFCVIHGFMPNTAATIFNLKGDPILNMAELSRNTIRYNPFGTILLLGGFGNLSGNIEMWDMEKRKQISSFKAPDTTELEWSPCGQYIMTATTAPRLRIGNGFKLWHYSGALLQEMMLPEKQELYEVRYAKFPVGTFTAFPIVTKKVKGIQSSQPKPSTQAYVPPFLRAGAVPETVATPPAGGGGAGRGKSKGKRGGKAANKSGKAS